MSAKLAAQQTALLDLLHLNTIDLIASCADSMPANGHISLKNSASALRGLRAYRANAQELSVQALQASYPTLQQLLGEENFSHLAQDFWQAMPPVRGDLAQWGGELAAFLSQVPALQALLAEHAYLPDVARVEWALHQAATASDAVLDAESFQRLATQDPAQLRLQFSPGCALLRSAYPVVALVKLHDARASDLHGAAREQISNGEAQTALIWRRGFRPMLERTDAASAALIEATLDGHSLSQALDAAMAQAADFDFSAWLSISVQTGLLIGVR
ncbi:DNA-binding domain-containing protein [Variovorax sp. PCZ-1]|uniref:HvfC/BufC N-terminal domain-containing protein n=1 Tax=Variovorax sp. PCZ-1 TaxID=2835533 RepID=UPI001BCA7E4F|nr:DNA-binding domain-containing protein [Variovorax sp. PCZ-1]MBS7806080.1 putative DNA-binding domain-containing protein [Variovorax sp. PCZ-1]